MAPYYDDGSCVIYHADCREVLPRVLADVMVTDPPYGVDYSSGWTGEVWEGGVYAGAADGSIRNDLDTTVRDEVLDLIWCPLRCRGWRVYRDER